MLLALAIASCTAPPARDGDGCWAQAYAERGYRGATTTYTGPTYEARFMQPAGSLALGPHALFEGFADDDYRRETVRLGPDSRIPDLARLAFERRVSSFKLDCTN